MASLYHKVYVALGGKKGSFLQKKWAKFRMMKVSREKSKLLPLFGMAMLKIFRESCQEHNIKGWLEYGTLLGAYREKSFIPHDNDLDVGMYFSDYTKEFEETLVSKGFLKKHEYYLVNPTKGTKDLMELGFSYRNFTIDIFLCNKSEKTRKSYIFLFDPFDESSQLKVKYFTLNPVEPLGVLTINDEPFSVPYRPDELLMKIYGDDFMIPQKGWMPSEDNPNVSYPDRSCEYGIHIRF